MTESLSFGAADVLSSCEPPSCHVTEPKTREEIVLQYAFLCTRAARRFVRPGLERGDLEQVAAIGLLKAVDRYDERRGTPFEAFAWIAVLGELLHHVRDHESHMRIPRGLREALPGFRRSTDRLLQRFEREPTDLELSADLRLAPDVVRDLRSANHAMRRADLDAWRGPQPSCETEADASCDRVDLGGALSRLSLRERRVVLGSLVLELSNVELASRLSLSARHVGRVRRRALERMHEVCALGMPA